MSRAKTIRIFLKDSESEGVKIADLSNSLAKIFVIPRAELEFTKTRQELNQPALYLLFDDERTSVYIGECENFNNRVKDHEAKKSFWQWAVICTTNSHDSSLNKADVKYLESYAVRKAIEIGRYQVQNSNVPNENTLDEFRQASVMGYFEDAELLLSALGYNVFDELKIESNAAKIVEHEPKAKIDTRVFDTIVSPCSEDGFEEAFVKEKAWWAVRIGQPAIPKLKYIALYEAAPVSSIRAYAKITKIEPYPDHPGRYKIFHDGNIVYLDDPVQLGINSSLSLQGSRYYKLEDIKASKTLGELTNRTYGTNYKG